MNSQVIQLISHSQVLLLLLVQLETVLNKRKKSVLTSQMLISYLITNKNLSTKINEAI